MPQCGLIVGAHGHCFLQGRMTGVGDKAAEGLRKSIRESAQKTSVGGSLCRSLSPGMLYPLGTVGIIANYQVLPYLTLRIIQIYIFALIERL